MIACTHPGKIGDALYSLATIERLCLDYNCKADFYTSEYCAPMKDLVEYQPYINKFYICKDYKITSFACGIQPWLMPIDETKYEKVFHLGFRDTPNIALHEFIAKQAKVSPMPISFKCPDIDTMDTPYIVIAPRNDVRYRKLYIEFIKSTNYDVAISGARGEYIGAGIDITGKGLLETASWISKSDGFIGSASNFVLSEGFPILKIVPHDGHTFDMRHLIYDSNHIYMENPKLADLLKVFNRMKTFSKTLSTDDYPFIENHVKHITNIIDVLKNAGAPYRFEHEHRKWEYGLAYKVLDDKKSLDILDVGGGGSVLAPAMRWLESSVHQVDMGEVGGWIDSQSKAIGKVMTFDQMNFMDFDPDKKYDAVTCISVIEHVDGDIEFFKKLLSHVKPGGVIILTTDFHPSGSQIVGGHIRTYNKDGMLKFADVAKKQGFTFFGGKPDYGYFQPNVNGCTFASLVMEKKINGKQSY